MIGLGVPSDDVRPCGRDNVLRRNAITRVRRLFVLLCGFEILPKTISTKGVGGRFILSEPVCAYLLDTEDGWILLDAGLNPTKINDPQKAKIYYADRGMMAPVIRAEHDLAAQFRAIGIGFGDVSRVILSHMHLDHAGCIAQFAHAPIYVQRREYERAFSDAAGIAYFKSDYDHPGLDWRLVDGDWEVMPGLTMLETSGHTPGHQSAVVRLPETGVIVLPFDAGDLQENFDLEIPPGETSDEAAALASIRRLKAILADTGGRLILLHDPVQIQQTRLAPEFYG
jgi:N-acyl homoserine lactone hydrolase